MDLIYIQNIPSDSPILIIKMLCEYCLIKDFFFFLMLQKEAGLFYMRSNCSTSRRGVSWSSASGAR